MQICHGHSLGIMCAHAVKLEWSTHTNLYTICRWYIAAELQYSRTVVHVMLFMNVLLCLHISFSHRNNMGIIQNHVGNNQ